MSIKQPMYLNRESTLLSFQERVLAQALDINTPLLERLRFLCIVSSNLDEFFEIRVADLKEQVLSEPEGVSLDGRAWVNVLGEVSTRAHELVQTQYQHLTEALLPQLMEQSIALHLTPTWTPELHKWAHGMFMREVRMLLTPIGLDPSHPFPRLYNKSLNFIVTLKGQNAYARSKKEQNFIAVVQVPRALPRVYRVPDGISSYEHGFVLLSSLVQTFIHEIFPGMQVTGCYQFRVTRDSDLDVDEDATNLRTAVQGELRRRHFGNAVRLELAAATPHEIEVLLQQQYELTEQDTYRCDGPVNLTRLSQIVDMTDRPDLKFSAFTPRMPTALTSAKDKPGGMFSVLQNHDVLLHHPFESFQPVIDMVASAALDPQVVAIKMTVYRTGSESVLMQHLLAAAQAGKEVTVVVELMARFDEEANINWAAQLEKVGAHVVYGVVGFKTHAKMLLLLRKDKSGRIRRFAHLGTGNYHPRTTRLYTDFGLLTSNPRICEDVDSLFFSLTGVGGNRPMKTLLQAPFTLQQQMVAMIRREARHARAGKPARIIAKMNSLLELQIINELYKASQAGVKIELIVRGICALRPGVPGLSDNIKVTSVVGRFLEHTRVFYFHQLGDPAVYLSSADWMDRNFFRRVEVAFPILDPVLRERVIEEGLKPYLQDDVLSWIMNKDGQYTRRKKRRTTAASFNAHDRLLERLC